MMIKIVTDSGCDYNGEEAIEKGIRVIPLKTIIGEKEYLDGVTITTKEFYQKLIESEDFPKTSQIAPYEYEEVFACELKNCDHILCVTISSKLSGCFQSALIAASEFNGKVTVVDSGNVSVGERNLLDLALEKMKTEDDPKRLKDYLEVEKKKITVVALLDTLEYLKKGGRISAAAAMAGSVLSIKPVVAVQDGEVVVLGKARGSKNGNNLLTECVRKKGRIDFSKPCCVAYTGLSDILLKKYLEDSAELLNFDKDMIPIHTIGSTIGTHLGPGAIAAAFSTMDI